MGLRLKIALAAVSATLLVYGVGFSRADGPSAEWNYEYFDDFDTDKAEIDSCDHSLFWPEGASRPSDPYLHFSTSLGVPPRSLVFVGHQAEPAHLSYRFALDRTAADTSRFVGGAVEFDVILASKNNCYFDVPSGAGLFYSFSEDGRTWSKPAHLNVGHHSVALASKHGQIYVSFSGTQIAIDNLEVRLSGPSADIYVPRDFPTIQAAIDAASDGQTIEVGPGVYGGAGNRDIELRGKRITVRSSAGADQTIIDCGGVHVAEPTPENSHRGFYIHQGETSDSVIQGFTIQGARIGGSEVPGDGLQWRAGPGQPVGGGVYCEYSSPSMINCHVIDCAAEIGGGIGCVGGAPVISGCTIINCKAGGLGPAESGGYGAGIGLIRGADARIINCEIRENSGYYNSYGGGLYCRNSTAVVTGCDISSNSATGNINGGGVYCSGRRLDIVLENCVVSNNAASEGAGIFVEAEHGVQTAGCPGSSCPGCRVAIRNCTIAHNRLPSMINSAVGGIYSNCENITAKNAILWYNDGRQVEIMHPHVESPVSFSNVQGGYPGLENIDQEPLFAPTDVPDYHLQSRSGRFVPQIGQWTCDEAHSPCIDAGDPDDSAGYEPVPNGGRINMGAYGGSRQASKSVRFRVYHADVRNGNDGNDGLSRPTAFATIQKAIDTAKEHDVILVWPGTYTESLDYKGKTITVQSAADAAVLEAPGDNAVSFYTGEGPGSILKNFVITNSDTAIFIADGSPTICQVTVVNNNFGISAYARALPSISNSIFWNNRDGDLYGTDAEFSFVPQLGSWDDLEADPLFADPANGDFHLRSERGRYHPTTGLWVLDNVTSPYIDGGDPAVSPAAERMPNGGRINLGAYGNTAYASMSDWPMRGDINRDGVVNFADMAALAEGWLSIMEWKN